MLIMPVLTFIYAMIRPPQWSKKLIRPNWMMTNLLSSLSGIIFAAIPTIFFLDHNGYQPWFAAYFVECVSVIGCLITSCTITDMSLRSIDRHMMRALYVIQFIVSCTYLYYDNIDSTRNWLIMSGIMLGIMVFILATGYIKFLKFGASDARCWAVMVASTFPILGSAITWPIIMGVIVIFITAAVMITLTNGYNPHTYSYDGNGKITSKKTDEIKGITSRKSKKAFGAMKVPAGHALTIPFMIYMLIWLL